MAGSGPGSKGTFGDINITPLTDVFLVLLVVIIIAAPSMQSLQKDISAPTMNLGDPLNKDWKMVEVNKLGLIYIDGEEIPEDMLVEKLKTMLPKAKDQKLVIRGDKDTVSGKILAVLDDAVEAGYTQTYIAGEVEQLSATGIE